MATIDEATIDEVAIDLPGKYYSAIGELIFRCAQLEYQLHEIIWRAIGIDNKQGRTLTIGADAKVLRSIIATIVSTKRWVKDDATRAEMRQVSAFAKDLSRTRNLIAHGTWQYPQDGDKQAVRLHLTYEFRLLPKRSDLTDAAIVNLAAKARHFNARAAKLIRRLERPT